VPGAREQIRSLVLSGDTFDQPAGELGTLQLEAARETFTAHRERVPLLRTRADETGVDEVTSLRRPRTAAVLAHQLQVVPRLPHHRGPLGPAAALVHHRVGGRTR